MIVACGTLLADCVKAAATLREEGLDVGVINARFVKPLDTETILRAVETCGFVVTVEEGTLMGGFGSAVLEAATDAGLSAVHCRRLGIPDRFIEHGERGELLALASTALPGGCPAPPWRACCRPAAVPTRLVRRSSAFRRRAGETSGCR